MHAGAHASRSEVVQQWPKCFKVSGRTTLPDQDFNTHQYLVYTFQFADAGNSSVIEQHFGRINAAVVHVDREDLNNYGACACV